MRHFAHQLFSDRPSFAESRGDSVPGSPGAGTPVIIDHFVARPVNCVVQESQKLLRVCAKLNTSDRYQKTILGCYMTISSS